jgi:hypothetical protein
MARVDQTLPLFQRVFAGDRNWLTLTPRLVKSGLLPNDGAVLDRIQRVAGVARTAAKPRVVPPRPAAKK